MIALAAFLLASWIQTWDLSTIDLESGSISGRAHETLWYSAGVLHNRDAWSFPKPSTSEISVRSKDIACVSEGSFDIVDGTWSVLVVPNVRGKVSIAGGRHINNFVLTFTDEPTALKVLARVAAIAPKSALRPKPPHACSLVQDPGY